MLLPKARFYPTCRFSYYRYSAKNDPSAKFSVQDLMSGIGTGHSTEGSLHSRPGNYHGVHWAVSAGVQRLRRVFPIDIETRRECGGAVKGIA